MNETAAAIFTYTLVLFGQPIEGADEPPIFARRVTDEVACTNLETTLMAANHYESSQCLAGVFTLDDLSRMFPGYFIVSGPGSAPDEPPGS